MVTQSPREVPKHMAYESTTMLLREQNDVACALVQDLLPLYLEGEVSSHSRDMIVEHLGRCDRCSGFLAGAQSVQSQLRRDQAQRTNAVKQDQPSQQLVRSGSAFAKICLNVSMSVGFVVSCLMAVTGVNSFYSAPLLAGLFLFAAIVTTFVLLLLGEKCRLTAKDWKFTAGLVITCLGGVWLVSSTGTDSLNSVLLSLVMIVAGLYGFWSTRKSL